jgi:hypothetical protein
VIPTAEQWLMMRKDRRLYTAQQQRASQVRVNGVSTSEDNGCEHRAECHSLLLSSREWEGERNKRQRWFFTAQQQRTSRVRVNRVPGRMESMVKQSIVPLYSAGNRKEMEINCSAAKNQPNEN